MCDQDALAVIRCYIEGGGRLSHQMIADLHETTIVTVWKITSFRSPYGHLENALSEHELSELVAIRKATKTPLAKIRKIRQLYDAGYSIPQCAAATHVGYTTAYRIAHRLSYKDIE